MRIISGSARGRRLVAPKGRRTRPTPGRVREALFSILAFEIQGARILDLFAGTGALGIEALSRGARAAVFVEADRAALTALHRNLEGFKDVLIDVLPMPATRALKVLGARKARFEIAFLDPPFAQHLLEPCLQALFELNLMEASGVVVAEHSRHNPVPAAEGYWDCFDSRRFGDVMLSFFRQKGTLS